MPEPAPAAVIATVIETIQAAERAIVDAVQATPLPDPELATALERLARRVETLAWMARGSQTDGHA